MEFIKKGIVNYLKSLKYMFSIIGVFAVCALCGLSLALPSFFSRVSEFTDGIKKEYVESDEDFSAVYGDILSAVSELDWEDPFSALSVLSDEESFTLIIEEKVGALSNGLIEQISSFCVGLRRDVALFSVFCFFGFVGGFMAVRCLIRRNIAKRSVFQFILAISLDALLSATLVSFCTWLIAQWAPSVFISTLASMLLYAFVSLIEAYAVHGRKKVAIGKVLNLSLVGKLLVTGILIYLIASAFVALTVILTNITVGFLIGLAFMQIAFIVINLNAESYVLYLTRKRELLRPSFR